MSTPPGSRRALGPGAGDALGPAPVGSRTPPWSLPALQRPAVAPATPEPPAAAAQAVGSIAGLRIVSCPAAVLETAFHVATALLQRSDEEPLLREAVEGLVAVIPQYLAPARKPATPPTPARLRPAPEQTAAGTGRPLA